MTGLSAFRHVALPLLMVASVMPLAFAERFPSNAIPDAHDTAFSVTSFGSGDLIAFDLDERIWLLSGDDPFARTLTNADSRYRRPAFSHDGRFIAFESVHANYHQIFLLETANGKIRQLTFGPYDHFAPAWSPLENRIVMSSNRGGTLDIWEVDLDTQLLQQLTTARTDETDPAWDSEGQRLAYVVTGKRSSSIQVWSPGEQPRRVLHSRHRIQAPAWQPGTGMLTYTQSSENGSQLFMLILSMPPTSKPLIRNEQVAPRPVHWIDRNRFLYSADGRIRRRGLGLLRYDDVPFTQLEVPAGH